MKPSRFFWKRVKQYIAEGDRVAELYHGENGDILKNLSRIVSEKGFVYGIDSLNPFDYFEPMKNLDKLNNLKLINSTIPDFPTDVINLDAVIIREFLWTYPIPFNGKEDSQTYKAIDATLKNKGHLILHLNRTEQKSEPFYQNTIRRHFPNYKEVCFKKDLLAYQKI